MDIAAGASTTFTTNDGVTPISGTWTALGQVDYTNAVAESNEGNNTLSKQIGSTTPPTTSGPDLIVTNITAAANNRYNIVVKNQGGTATGSKWIGVQLRRNGNYADWGGKTVDIAAGASTTFTTVDGVAPISGSWTAQGQVDYTNAVVETNEANNTFTKTLP